jgi:hypothetical protein
MKMKTRMMTLVAVFVVAALGVVVTRCGDESLLGSEDPDLENPDDPDGPDAENPGGYDPDNPDGSNPKTPDGYVEVEVSASVFSNGAGETTESAIDMIRARAGEAKHLIITMESGSEPVSFNAATDLGTTGLVLKYDPENPGNTGNNTSPASVVIEGGGRTVDLTGTADGSLITVGNGVTLTLKNITLKGLNANEGKNTAALIYVDGGHLIIEEGAVIMDNNSTSSSGDYADGGVGGRTGKITMIGGKISGNESKYGGGICIDSPDEQDAPDYGGELFEFTMVGGDITDNKANESGGGIEMVNDSFRFVMSGGTISGNQAKTGGGADFIYDGAATMNGGKISENTATKGGGVSAFFGVTFTMVGEAEISGNIATSGVGGGVLFSDDVGAVFTMNGGKISGNTASGNGGGVYVVKDGTAGGAFIKTSFGVIYGNEDAANKNTSTAGQGHAVYVKIGNGYKKRNSTAGTSVSLDSGNNANWE